MKSMTGEKELKKALEEILGREIKDLPEGIRLPVRLEQVLNTLEPKKKEKTDFGEMGEIDWVRKEWKRGKNTVVLTEKEIEILSYLLKQKNEVSKEKLLSEIFKYNPGVTTHTIETHIYRLRQKIKKLGIEEALKTGKEGYILAK